MFSGRLTQAVLHLLDRIPARKESGQELAPHHRTGRRGEEDAYFFLRRRGYIMVARNFRSARHHGEIDLIAWDKDVLCFIEVKTRTTHDVKPAAAAVHRSKRRAIRRVVRDYLSLLPEPQFPQTPQWRFDVVTVYYEKESPRPAFELFQNSALSS